jgi:hypothetical protein
MLILASGFFLRKKYNGLIFSSLVPSLMSVSD